MDSVKQADPISHEAIISKELNTDKQGDKEREEWVAYWEQRRKLYEKILWMAAPTLSPDEDMTEYADSEPCGLLPEVKRALWWMFAIIVSLTIINGILWHLYLSSFF